MEVLDDIFSNDGWVITDTSNGKTKVATCNANETDPFNKTRDNWVTFSENVQQKQSIHKVETEKALKPPFREVGIKNVQNRIGFYLIRDILNFHKPNSLTGSFLADNIPLKRVLVCARITSYERKNDYCRLILDDTTSSILCMVRINQQHDEHQESQCEEEVEIENIEESSENHSLSWAMKMLSSQYSKLTNNSSISFDQTSLGRPVRILGYLREYYGKNYIFAYKFTWISEEHLVNYLHYIIKVYEYKENYMFE